MKNKQINTISNQPSRQSSKSSVINIENTDVLEIFGINNENLSYFESSLPLKIFQKGNELNIKGEKKYRNILRNAILKTLTEIKLNKNLREKNLIQENLKMQLAVWLSVKEKYAAHCHTEKAAKENEDRLRRAKEDREKKILEQVANGTIEESHGFARREPGDHPGPSTREIRKAKAQLRDSSS